MPELRAPHDKPGDPQLRSAIPASTPPRMSDACLSGCVYRTPFLYQLMTSLPVRLFERTHTLLFSASPPPRLCTCFLPCDYGHSHDLEAEPVIVGRRTRDKLSEATAPRAVLAGRTARTQVSEEDGASPRPCLHGCRWPEGCPCYLDNYIPKGLLCLSLPLPPREQVVSTASYSFSLFFVVRLRATKVSSTTTTTTATFHPPQVLRRSPPRWTLSLTSVLPAPRTETKRGRMPYQR